MATVKMAGKIRKFIDIGANLCDGMYQGSYHGSQKHAPDLSDVLKRAASAGVESIIITGTNLQESKEALKLALEHAGPDVPKLFTTVGCHPTRCDEFDANDTDPDKYLSDLLDTIQTANNGKKQVESRAVAVGECGLDYARTHFCQPEVQRKYFEKQLSLAELSGLPLFLHCRDAADDFVRIISPWRERITGGVVHSFDGNVEELQRMLDLDFYIGINGCSLKTADNLKVASTVPLNRLLLETDCPWCEIKPTHAGYTHVTTRLPTSKKWQAGHLLKGRNEPCNIVQVLEVVAAVRGEEPELVADAAYRNALNLFFPQ